MSLISFVEMQAKVIANEQELSKHVPPEIHAQRMENLERQKETIAANLLNLEKEHECVSLSLSIYFGLHTFDHGMSRTVKESLEVAKREEDDLRRRKKQLEEMKGNTGPMIRYCQ